MNVTIYPGRPSGVNFEAASVVKNIAGATVQYCDTEDPFISEGSIAVGASQTLSGTYFFSTPATALLSYTPLGPTTDAQIATLGERIGEEEVARAEADAALDARTDSLESTSLVIAEAPLHFRDPRVGGLGNATDESATLQAWANMIPSGGGELLLDAGDYLGANIMLKSGTKLIGPGARVALPPNAASIGAPGPYTGHRQIFTNENANDVAGDTGIEIAHLTLDGAVADGNDDDEFYFTVALWGVSDFSVHHLTIENVRGDGIHVGRKPALAQPTVSDFEIHNIHLRNVGVDAGVGAGRQGVAISEGRRFAVRDITGDTVAAFLVNIETDDSSQIIEDFVVDGVRGYNSDSLVAVLHRSGGTARRGFIRNLSHRDGTGYSPAYYVSLEYADSITVDGLHYDLAPSLAPVYVHAGGCTRLKIRNTPGEYCLLSQTSAQTNIANVTSTALEWTDEREDPDGMHDPTNSTTRKKITALVPGIYSATVNLRFSSTAGTYRQIDVRVNGSGSPVGNHKGAAALNMHSAAFRAFRLAAGDYIEVYVTHDAGSAIDLVKDADYSPEISLVKIA